MEEGGPFLASGINKLETPLRRRYQLQRPTFIRQLDKTLNPRKNLTIYDRHPARIIYETGVATCFWTENTTRSTYLRV